VRRSEWLTLAALGGTALAAIGFIVAYLADPDTQLLGAALGLAFAFAGAAAILAGKRVVDQSKASDEYHEFGDPTAQAEVVETVEGISRRKLIVGATATAGLTLGAAIALPVASLGPNVGEQRTPWRRGRRLVTEEGEPVRMDDVLAGTFFTAFPEGADKRDIGAPVIVVRVAPETLRLPPGREGSAPAGVVAYSKICPHAGCAVSIYRHPTYQGAGEPPDALICPCHFSTFDPARGGKLLFGPAGRALPQLPLAVDGDGVLIAGGGFYDRIGPSAS
jgi:ubiquinol-cytochrome c reductase iron-sulfur subunit